MKKLYIYLLLLFAVTACTKKTELVFSGTVDQRLQAALAQDSSVLVNSTYGWKAVLCPGNGQGAYFFYLQFKTDGTVTMMGDVDTTTATKSAASTFRLKAIQLPALIFDTYNYIHKLSDPDPEVNGGTAGKGQYSDFEFSFLSVKADSVVLKGNVNGSSLVLSKATQADRDAYAAGTLRRLMDTAKNYTNANKYLFLQFPDGRQVPFGLSVRSKMLVLQYVDGNNNIVNLNTKFYFAPDSLRLVDPIVYNGYSFYDIFWDNTAKLFYVKINGQRTNVGASATVFKLPWLPELYKELFKTYASIYINPLELDGLPASFYVIWKDCVTKMATGGRTLNSVELIFPAANQMQVKFSYVSSGSSFVATASYNMTLNATGLASFTLGTDIATTAVRTAVKSFTDNIINNKFTFAYVANTATPKLLGGLFHETNAASYFFGELK
jgi:hypothetical protein